ncbi:MAG: lamin tail domain-containing protein, partial [Planctomycetota bacterium]
VRRNRLGCRAEATPTRTDRQTDELPAPDLLLRESGNVVCVMAFNRTRSSRDFKIDVELYDPFGPDLSRPTLVDVVPVAGRAVRVLEQIEVSFSEVVTGVDAADLLIGGVSASSLQGAGVGPYVVSFPAVEDGVVEIRFSDDHGITDIAEEPNAFIAPSPWSYEVDSTLPPDDVVITEIMAASQSSLRDDDGEYGDWIELFNRGATPVDLRGWALSDDDENSGAWVFPDRTLEPGEYLVVFASGKNRAEGDDIHTSFRLSAAGEFVGLYNAESPRGLVSGWARFPEQRRGVSYGLTSEGESVYMTSPTPGVPNGDASAVLGVVAEPLFSVKHGFFDEPFDLELRPASNADTVIYTLDGSEPEPGNGEEYAGEAIRISPIQGRGLALVRAASYRDGYLPSEIVTRSYVFVESVLGQPRNPPGLPTRWGSSQTADYQVDPRIVGGDNRERAKESLLSIPTMSIVTHVNNLFDPRTGIYANPSASGDAWERPVSMEVIYPDGSQEG